MVDREAGPKGANTEPEHRVRWRGGRWEKWVGKEWRPITPLDGAGPLTTATPHPALRSDEPAGGEEQAAQMAEPKQRPSPGLILRSIPGVYVVIQQGGDKLKNAVLFLKQKFPERLTRARRSMKH